LIRLRITLLAIAYAIVGLAAHSIFDRILWSLVVAPMIPAVLAVALTGQRPGWRLLGAVGSIIAATTVASTAAEGSTDDIGDAISSGVRRLISTDWPSPVRADLVATVALAIAVPAALSYELAQHRRWRLLPLLPLLLTYVAIIGASAPDGVELLWLLAIGVPSVIFAAFQNEGQLGERWTLLRGERRLVPLVVIATLLAMAVSLPISLTTRADPRTDDPAQLTEPLLDPIEAILALQALDPARPLYAVEGGGRRPS
jgi:hypothetical protein